MFHIKCAHKREYFKHPVRACNKLESLSISSLTSRGIRKLLVFTCLQRTRQLESTSVEAHTFRKHCKACSRHPSLPSFTGWSVLYFKLSCVSGTDLYIFFPVVCKPTCLMHIFIMSDVLHHLYNASFHIISLRLRICPPQFVLFHPLYYSYTSFFFTLAPTIHHGFSFQECHH